MRSNNLLQTDPNRQLAYDQLQSVIMQLAARPVDAQRRDRSEEFKQLVEQALAAYRNYMRVVAA
jgi:hypothetical protein